MEEKALGSIPGAFNQLRFQNLLNQLFRFAVSKNYSIAIYRLPSDDKIKLVIDVLGTSHKVKVDLEELGSGFLFSPFSNFDNSSAFFINGDIFVNSSEEIEFSKRISYAEKSNYLEEIENFKLEEQATTPYYSNTTKIEEISKPDYCSIVEKATSSFNRNSFQKVVLSRCKSVDFNVAFDILKAFFGLCNAYPNAFISVTSLPHVGTWIGASPELLISVDKNKIFRTAAVAGTLLYDSKIELPEVGWKQKDIEEQAMVSRYIINCFKKIRLREFDEVGPRTARAGNLVHLKTDFIVDTKAVNFPQLGTIMLELLHPTSAICGMPRDLASDFINKNEGYDRSFYSGFLGPINLEDESHIYVNIRCMQLLENKAVLYAGAGVTRESNPLKEWEETEIKMNTMMELLVKMGFVIPS